MKSSEWRIVQDRVADPVMVQGVVLARVDGPGDRPVVLREVFDFEFRLGKMRCGGGLLDGYGILAPLRQLLIDVAVLDGPSPCHLPVVVGSDDPLVPAMTEQDLGEPHHVLLSVFSLFSQIFNHAPPVVLSFSLRQLLEAVLGVDK